MYNTYDRATVYLYIIEWSDFICLHSKPVEGHLQMRPKGHISHLLNTFKLNK